jgi:hypothetical protein
MFNSKAASMSRMSCRAYGAAGASLVAVGTLVANPMAGSVTSPHVQLPTARSVEVNLTAAEKWLFQTPVAWGATEVAKISDAARTMEAVAQANAPSVPDATSAVAAGAKAIAKTMSRVVEGTASGTATPAHNGTAVAPHQADTAIAAARAATGGPNLGKIVGLVGLPVSFALEVAATANRVAENVFFAAADVTFALATQDPTLLTNAQIDLTQNIPHALRDLLEQFDVHANAVADALGLPPFDPKDKPFDPASGGDEDADADGAVKAAGTRLNHPSTVTVAKPSETKPTKSGQETSASNTEHHVSQHVSPATSASTDDSATDAAGAESSVKHSTTSTSGTTDKHPTTKTSDTTTKDPATTTGGRTTKPGAAKAKKASAHSGAPSGAKDHHHAGGKHGK